MEVCGEEDRRRAVRRNADVQSGNQGVQSGNQGSAKNAGMPSGRTQARGIEKRKCAGGQGSKEDRTYAVRKNAGARYRKTEVCSEEAREVRKNTGMPSVRTQARGVEKPLCAVKRPANSRPKPQPRPPLTPGPPTTTKNPHKKSRPSRPALSANNFSNPHSNHPCLNTRGLRCSSSMKSASTIAVTASSTTGTRNAIHKS